MLEHQIVNFIQYRYLFQIAPSVFHFTVVLCVRLSSIIVSIFSVFVLYIFLAFFHFSHLTSCTFLTSSFYVFLGPPLFLIPSSFASYTFLVSLSSPILATCPSHFNCIHCIVTSVDSICCGSLLLSYYLLSYYYLASRLPYSMYVNRSC